ncbi:hypothetical protein K8I61_00400 [bacterium]|nr:hypothetical protein [bacterium]
MRKTAANETRFLTVAVRIGVALASFHTVAVRTGVALASFHTVAVRIGVALASFHTVAVRIGVALAAILAFAIPAVARTIGGHRDFARWAIEQGLEPGRESRPATRPLAKAAPLALGVESIGFYPYWSTEDPADLPYDVLSVIAWFSVTLGSNGDITVYNGWPDGTLIDEAHANGVKVALTVNNFTPTEQTTLLSSAINRANAIDNIVFEVTDAGADGVNIDFELLPATQKANFVTFIEDLADALRAAIPGAHLSIDTPAVDWSGAFDYDKLAAAADYLFIMAYDYHYKGGDPGPVSPLFAGTLWSPWSIEWTLNDYETYIFPYDLANTIVGLPLYGYDWPTTTGAVPGTKRGTGLATILATAVNMANSGSYGPRLWDAGSRTPYLVYDKAGDGWHQLWYDDAASLAERFEYAALRHTGGVGFWALGYEGSREDVWDALDATFGIPGDDDDAADDDASDDDAADDDDDDGGIGQLCCGR